MEAQELLRPVLGLGRTPQVGPSGDQPTSQQARQPQEPAARSAGMLPSGPVRSGPSSACCALEAVLVTVQAPDIVCSGLGSVLQPKLEQPQQRQPREGVRMGHVVEWYMDAPDGYATIAVRMKFGVGHLQIDHAAESSDVVFKADPPRAAGVDWYGAVIGSPGEARPMPPPSPRRHGPDGRPMMRSGGSERSSVTTASVQPTPRSAHPIAPRRQRVACIAGGHGKDLRLEVENAPARESAPRTYRMKADPPGTEGAGTRAGIP